MTITMIVQLLIVLLALWVGSRFGSLALGAISGIGLAILVFGFGLKPGTPPTDVIYIIIAAVTCAGVLQASGGMDWMIQVAERLLRKHPNRITFLAPLTTFFLTVLVGTGHVVYTLMPIIAVVAFASISAANGFHVNNLQIIMITIPACVCGLMAAATASYNRGLDLDKDPKFQALLKDPQQYNYIYGNSATTLDKKIEQESKNAVFIFLGALAIIVVFSIVQMFGGNILPTYDTIQAVKGGPATVTLADGVTETAKQIASAGVVLPGVTEVVSKPLAMNLVIQIIMISAAAFMIIFCKAKPKKAVGGAVWQSGMVAVGRSHLWYRLVG